MRPMLAAEDLDSEGMLEMDGMQFVVKDEEPEPEPEPEPESPIGAALIKPAPSGNAFYQPPSPIPGSGPSPFV